MLDVINLALTPLAVNASTSNTAFITYLSTDSILYSSLYYPSTGPQLAATITSILNGSATITSQATSTATTPSVEPYDLPINAVYGIRGAVAVWRTDAAAAEYLPQVEFQDTLAGRYPLRKQHTGNFSIKTKHPVRYINGEFDPVNLRMSAYNGSEGFTDSVVLSHSGYGHGGIVNPSACVHGKFQAYFANGTLPYAGTRCAPDMRSWELAGATNGSSANESSATASPTPSAHVSGGSASQFSTHAATVVLLCAMVNVL